jgi:hypothetical protein
MHIKVLVTGHLAVARVKATSRGIRGDEFPSPVKQFEVRRSLQLEGKTNRNAVGIVPVVGVQLKVSHLFRAVNLKNKTANGKCAYVRMNMVAEGKFSGKI